VIRRTLLALFAACLVAACSNGQASPAATATATSAPPPTTPPSPRPSPEVQWTFKTQGAIWGSAAVSNGVVYVGSNDHSLYAVDIKTGAQKWKFDTAGEVRSTAAFTTEAAVISSDSGKLYAVDQKTGRQVWQTDIHNDLKRPRLDDKAALAIYDYDFLTSSPIVANGVVYVGSRDGNVYAVDAKSGQVRWTFKTGDRIRATPAFADDLVYIGSWDGYLYALKADTGALVWKYFAGQEVLQPQYLVTPIQSTAFVANGVVYCASRKAILFALDAATGKELWQESNGSGNWYESSPVVGGGVVYIGSSAAGQLFATDARAGSQVGSLGFAAAAWSTPLVDRDTVYIGAEEFDAASAGHGGLYAVALASNGLPAVKRWTFAVGPTLEESGTGGVNSSPLLVDRTLYFGGLDGVLYALGV
jgi:outer membrane protein assembly factor BamB